MGLGQRLRRLDDRVLGPVGGRPLSVRQAQRLAALYLLLSLVLAILGAVHEEPLTLMAATSIGFSAGIFFGRVAEAREAPRGRGLRDAD